MFIPFSIHFFSDTKGVQIPLDRLDKHLAVISSDLGDLSRFFKRIFSSLFGQNGMKFDSTATVWVQNTYFYRLALLITHYYKVGTYELQIKLTGRGNMRISFQ